MLLLKELRKQNNLTQEELAVLVGVERGYISMVEIGIRRPSPEVAMRIGGALGFDWTRFYTEEIKTELRGEDERLLETSKA